MDEDTRDFLSMLDAAAERAFEAYTEKTEAEASSVAIPQSKQILQHSSNLQGLDLGPQLSLNNTIPFPSDLSTFIDEPRNRRKRSRTSEQPTFQQVVADNPFKLGLRDKNLSLTRENHFVSWPQNFTFQSNAANKSVGGSGIKQSSFSVKDHHQLPKKAPSRIRRNLSNTGAVGLDQTNVGNEEKAVEKVVDFSKEIEDAISRIESLIPSLQKLVSSVHSPEQKNVDSLGLPNSSSSVNQAAHEKEWVISTEKSAALGKNMVGKQAGQMLTKCNFPVPSRVKWSRNVNHAGDDDDMLRQSNNGVIEWSNVDKTQRMVDKPFNFNAQTSQVPGPSFKAGMGRSESLKGTVSTNRSFASHKPEHIQGSKIMPRQSSCVEAMEKDVISRPCTQAPCVGPTKFTRHNGTGLADPSQQRWSQSHTVMSADSLNKNAALMKNINEASHSKVPSHDQTSEETSWSSCTSSSAMSQQSGSPFSSSGTYESSGSDYYDSDESEPQHEIVGRSARRKPAEIVTESSASGYDTNSSSYYNSRDEDSDIGSSSSMRSVQSHEWDPRKERKKKGRLKRIRKKLGMIFHHHHHHHHHYRDKNVPDASHARSLWTRLGEIFRNTKNNNDHHHKPKVEKPGKPEIKTVAKRKQQGGHFHALVGGLMRHMKPSRKPKQVKNGIKGLGKGRHKGKKLPWLPKIQGGRGGVKVSNKGKAKLGNYRTKSMAAAKMILGK